MVQSIDSTLGATNTTSTDQSKYRDAMQDAMGAVAQQLGMSATDLQSALKSGQTLTQIASSKGVSASSLQSTIQTSLQKDLPNASSTQLANLTNRMVNGHRGGGHHAHAAGGGASSSAASTSGAGSADASFEEELLAASSSSSSASGSSLTSSLDTSGAGTSSANIYL